MKYVLQHQDTGIDRPSKMNAELRAHPTRSHCAARFTESLARLHRYADPLPREAFRYASRLGPRGHVRPARSMDPNGRLRDLGVEVHRLSRWVPSPLRARRHARRVAEAWQH
jgi:hypothetical protein